MFSVVILSSFSEHQFLKRAECRKTVKHKKSKEQSTVGFLQSCPSVNSNHILLDPSLSLINVGLAINDSKISGA